MGSGGIPGYDMGREERRHGRVLVRVEEVETWQVTFCSHEGYASDPLCWAVGDGVGGRCRSAFKVIGSNCLPRGC